MNKLTFLEELRYDLKNLSAKDREEIIQDFEEHFEIGRTEGKTDEEIIRSLGSPQQIAKDVQAAQPFEKAQINQSEQSSSYRIWPIIGLCLFNLIIILGPSIAITGVILATWIVAFSFVIQIFMLIIQWVTQPNSFYLFELFASITLVGSGLLLFTVANYITNTVIRIFSKYIAFNVRIMKGEKRS